MSRKRALLNLILSLVTGTALLALLTGFVPDREGRQLRRTTNTASVAQRPGDKSHPLHESGEGKGWMYRGTISREERGPVYTPSETHGELLVFTKNGIAFSTVAGLLELHPAGARFSEDALQPIAGTGETVLAATSLPASYGEALNADGRPLRLLAGSTDALRESCPLPPGFAPKAAVRVGDIPEYVQLDNDLFSRAQRYKKLVEYFAERFRVSTELVYAIIHAESNFQPGTVSNRRATGLMQLLPSTAGGEVHKFLYGSGGELNDQELKNPEINLRYGTAYLHLLLNRHFGDVANPESRELCAIAAYNLGPNALLGTFARDRDEAVSLINSMSPQELYLRLSKNLPVRETRNFVAKVLNSKKEFAEFQ